MGGNGGRTKEEEKLCALNTATHELGGSARTRAPYLQDGLVAEQEVTHCKPLIV